MKKYLISIPAVILILFASCTSDGKKASEDKTVITPEIKTDSVKWLRYTDDNLGIAFSVPRTAAEADSTEYTSGIIKSLGWMKPEDAQIDKGLNTFLCYEDGFMLHIWDNNFDIDKSADFAAYGNRIYDMNQMTKDAFVKYKNGHKSNIGNSDVYAFSVPVQLNSKECREEYQDVRIAVDKAIQEPAENVHWCTAIYFTHRQHHFRILYDENNANGKKILESFRIEE